MLNEEELGELFDDDSDDNDELLLELNPPDEDEELCPDDDEERLPGIGVRSSCDITPKADGSMGINTKAHHPGGKNGSA